MNDVGCMMQNTTPYNKANIWELLSEIPDPEIPVISIAELGVLREIEIINSKVIVTITPTYSGCPAMKAFEDDIKTIPNTIVEINIVVYDQEQRFVIVKTNHEVAELINNTLEHPTSWALVYDLKFLIKKVIEWYEENGDDLVFLAGRSRSRFNFDPALIFGLRVPILFLSHNRLPSEHTYY